MSWEMWLVLGAGILGLLFAVWKAYWVGRQDSGTEQMRKISDAIRQGAMAYLFRQLRVLVIFGAVVGALLALGYGLQHPYGWKAIIAISFLCGAACSWGSGYFGMRVATKANVRTTHAARTSLNSALQVAFSGGSVMGMTVVSLGVIGITVLLLIYWVVFKAEGNMTNIDLLLQVITGFSFGASSIALFARVGGGIYTKAADVGADLVGKVEAGIPEDDPRNPATIADNVGDNVGDVAGMGADLFESYVGSIIAAMILGYVWVAQNPDIGMGPIFLPLFIAGAGILVSGICTFFVRTKEGANPQTALNIGTFSATIIMIILTYVLASGQISHGVVVGGHTYSAFGVFMAVVGGLLAGSLIGFVTEFYTSESRKPARRLSKEALTGPATIIIAGLALGMQSTAIPILLLSGAVILAYSFAGLYGIAMAGLGMLSTTGIQLAIDAYGPIADNSGGIAQMSKLPPEVRGRTDRLDAVGNTTAAIGKGFAIGSAALTAMALFSAYQTQMRLPSLDLLDPTVMVGLFVGAMMAFLFSSISMKAVGRAASGMVEEVRRQFKEIPGLLEGTVDPDYRQCVDISTKAAIRQMIIPGTLAVAVPIAAGFIDPSGMLLGGVLAGVTVSGVLLAVFMANAGGAWDNAKKHIEAGAHGGKGSAAHKAAVVGDTVGDPFKDTSGPSLNILIKLMSIVALVLAPILQVLPWG